MAVIPQRDLIKHIARRCAVPDEVVKSVFDAFTEFVVDAVARRDVVQLYGFGKFRLKELTRLGNKKGFLAFKCGVAVKARLTEHVNKPTQEENLMDKYGVALDQNKKLQAQLTKQCPDCKAPLTTVNPPECPNCGTKPFEPTPEAA